MDETFKQVISMSLILTVTNQDNVQMEFTSHNRKQMKMRLETPKTHETLQDLDYFLPRWHQDTKKRKKKQ